MTHSIIRLYGRMLAILLVTLVAIFMLAHLTVSTLIARETMQHELATQGKMLADLAEQDGNIVIDARLLGQLLVNPDLLFGCIITGQNQIMGSVKGLKAKPEETAEQVCRSTEASHFWNGQPVRVMVPILSQKAGGAVGVVVMTAKAPLRMGTVDWIIIGGFTALVLGVMMGVLLAHVKKKIQAPLSKIATAAQRVSLYKDYSLRLSAANFGNVPTEIASVVDSMNSMLIEIEDRDSRLTRKTEELEKARQTAETANSVKSHFLANVSHELRTPLNAIIGFSTMLQRMPNETGKEKYQEYVRDIYDSGVHLLDVINDILDLSKVESGQMSIHLEPVSLPKIIDKALHIIQGEAHERRIDIYTDVPAKLPKLVADRVRIMQILLNLLSNALKFTAQGGKVVIRARAEEARNHIHYFEIEVEDNGFGMNPEQIDKVFISFNQADAGLSRKYEGVGLGLPLTKRLVELHHGKIKIDSTPGKGTIVTVRLPSDSALLD